MKDDKKIDISAIYNQLEETDKSALAIVIQLLATTRAKLCEAKKCK